MIINFNNQFSKTKKMENMKMTDAEIIGKLKGLTISAYNATEDILLSLLEGRTELLALANCETPAELLAIFKPLRNGKKINPFQETCDSFVVANIEKLTEMYKNSTKEASKYVFHSGIGAQKNVSFPEPTEIRNEEGDILNVKALTIGVRVFFTPIGTDGEGNTYSDKEARRKTKEHKEKMIKLNAEAKINAEQELEAESIPV